MKAIRFLIFLLLLSSSVLNAKTIVFLHGYMEDGMSWRNSSVTVPLLQNHWLDGGALRINQHGVQKYPQTISPKDRDVFYTVELPWTRPLLQQSQFLARYLHAIYSIRQQPISLVGHSIGGVVARQYLLANHSVPINALISIASPHLGSPFAELGLLAIKTPMDDLAKGAGFEELKDSKILLKELQFEKPNNYLYQLNHQQHPNIAYLSIIRKNKKIAFGKFDYAVPSYSQNMNNIWMLKGKSTVFSSNEGHGLTAIDGWVIAKFLEKLIDRD